MGGSPAAARPRCAHTIIGGFMLLACIPQGKGYDDVQGVFRISERAAQTASVAHTLHRLPASLGAAVKWYTRCLHPAHQRFMHSLMPVLMSTAPSHTLLKQRPTQARPTGHSVTRHQVNHFLVPHETEYCRGSD